VAKTQGRNLLKAKDYKMIEICSIMVANLDFYTDAKPMIGTVMELEWAFRVFNIPVIAIASDPDNNPYALHPWINQHVGAIVGSVEEVVELIRNFFI
jgi:nucleoside 2-deoxyribosyltransferase